MNRPGAQAIPTHFFAVQAPTPQPSISDDPAPEEFEWVEDGTTSIVRGLPLRFSKFPEKLIRGATSLASTGVDSITAMQIASLARK